MKCPSCGHDNIAGADACEECLFDLTHLDEPAPQTAIEKSVMTEPLHTVPTRPPLVVAPETPLHEVVAKLAEREGAALVVYEDTLIGIFSERDLLMKVGDRFADLLDMPIREFMTLAPETLGSDDPVAFALNRMDVGGFRHIPLEKDEQPVGLVSVRDILKHLATHYPDEINCQA